MLEDPDRSEEASKSGTQIAGCKIHWNLIIIMPGDEQILDDDDVVYRRIPYNMFDSSIDAVPSPQSFQPHRENDTDGISLWCANSKTP